MKNVFIAKLICNLLIILYYIFFQMKNYKEVFNFDNPHMIKIRDIIELPEGPVFIQEFLDCDLKTYSNEKGSMDYDNLSGLFLQMAKALVFLKVT